MKQKIELIKALKGKFSLIDLRQIVHQKKFICPLLFSLYVLVTNDIIAGAVMNFSANDFCLAT